jgi:hypothetical protein
MSDPADISNLQNQVANLQESVEYFRQVLTSLQMSQTDNTAIIRAIQALDLEISDLSGQNNAVYAQIKNYLTNLPQNVAVSPIYDTKIAELNTKIKLLSDSIQGLNTNNSSTELVQTVKHLLETVSSMNKELSTLIQNPVPNNLLSRIEALEKSSGSSSGNIDNNSLELILKEIQNLKSGSSPQVNQDGTLVKTDVQTFIPNQHGGSYLNDSISYTSDIFDNPAYYAMFPKGITVSEETPLNNIQKIAENEYYKVYYDRSNTKYFMVVDYNPNYPIRYDITIDSSNSNNATVTAPLPAPATEQSSSEPLPSPSPLPAPATEQSSSEPLPSPSPLPSPAPATENIPINNLIGGTDPMINIDINLNKPNNVAMYLINSSAFTLVMLLSNTVITLFLITVPGLYL